MRNKVIIMAQIAMMLAAGFENYQNSGKGVIVEPDTEGDKERLRLRNIEVSKKKGLKKFNINGQWILALNKKNAIRKANKMKNL